MQSQEFFSETERDSILGTYAEIRRDRWLFYRDTHPSFSPSREELLLDLELVMTQMADTDGPLLRFRAGSSAETEYLASTRGGFRCDKESLPEGLGKEKADWEDLSEVERSLWKIYCDDGFFKSFLWTLKSALQTYSRAAVSLENTELDWDKRLMVLERYAEIRRERWMDSRARFAEKTLSYDLERIVDTLAEVEGIPVPAHDGELGDSEYFTSASTAYLLDSRRTQWWNEIEEWEDWKELSDAEQHRWKIHCDDEFFELCLTKAIQLLRGAEETETETDYRDLEALKRAILKSSEAAYSDQFGGPGDMGGILHMTVGLAGEVGELANLVKKINRDGHDSVSKTDIGLEMADVLFYLLLLSNHLEIDLANFAEIKLGILQERYNER